MKEFIFNFFSCLFYKKNCTHLNTLKIALLNSRIHHSIPFSLMTQKDVSLTSLFLKWRFVNILIFWRIINLLGQMAHHLNSRNNSPSRWHPFFYKCFIKTYLPAVYLQVWRFDSNHSNHSTSTNSHEISPLNMVFARRIKKLNTLIIVAPLGFMSNQHTVEHIFLSLKKIIQKYFLQYYYDYNILLLL